MWETGPSPLRIEVEKINFSQTKHMFVLQLLQLLNCRIKFEYIFLQWVEFWETEGFVF
jgi:hypothetical protein